MPGWRKLLEQFRDPLVYLLVGAVVISLAAWITEGAVGVPVDAVVITAVLLVNAVLGYLQQARAESAVAALQAMTEATSTVLRAGTPTVVPSRDLVPGDVLMLAEGDAVGADARLLTATALRVAEAALTGESEPVGKSADPLSGARPVADRLNMVYRGTAVTQGVGHAVVTATGMDTEMGAIAELLEATEAEPSPLQRELAQVGRYLGLAVVAIAVVVIAVTLALSEIRSLHDLVTVLLLGVSLAVAAVPEGLPAIVSVVLAIGVQRMAARNAIVTSLPSVETLGCATVIASDKTGTLTQNEMTITRLRTASGEVHLGGVGYLPEGDAKADGAELTDSPLAREASLALTVGALANNARLEFTDGHWDIHGDPTEAAFLVAAHKLAGTMDRADRFTRHAEVPFTSERKMMSALVAHKATTSACWWPRAPRMCRSAFAAPCRSGTTCWPLAPSGVRPHSPTSTSFPRRASDTGGGVPSGGRRRMARRNRRGRRTLPRLCRRRRNHRPTEAGGADAVDDAIRAGVRVLMITGDHPGTARRSP